MRSRLRNGRARLRPSRENAQRPRLTRSFALPLHPHFVLSGKKLAAVRRNEGTTIIELMVYLVIFGVVVNMSSGLYMSSKRLAQVGESALDSGAGIEEVGREFVEAVHTARRVVNKAGDYNSSERQLVLELDNGEYLVFGLNEERHQVWKMRLVPKDDKLESDYFSAYRQEIDSLRFSYSSIAVADSRGVQMHLTVDNTGMKNSIPQASIFVAALRAGVGK